MKNLNAICLDGTTLYIFTKDCELFAIAIADFVAPVVPEPQF